MRVSEYLAKNLAALRGARNLTQAALAKLSSVPRSTITHIESGLGNPSLKNLSALAAGLRVSIEELLARPHSACALIRADEIRVERRAQGEAVLYKLLPDPIPGMELDRLEIEPGARLAGVPHLDNTKEYLTCIEGWVTVHIAGESYQLGRGDVLAFPGNQPHGYQNSGEKRVICISVVVLAPASPR